MAMVKLHYRDPSTVPTPETGYCTLFFDSTNLNKPTIKLDSGTLYTLDGGAPGTNGTNGTNGAPGANGYVDNDFRGAFDPLLTYSAHDLVTSDDYVWAARRSTSEVPGVEVLADDFGGNVDTAGTAATGSYLEQDFTVDSQVVIDRIDVTALGTLPSGTSFGIIAGGIVREIGTTSAAVTNAEAHLDLDGRLTLDPGVTYTLFVNDGHLSLGSGAAVPSGHVLSAPTFRQDMVVDSAHNLPFSLRASLSNPWKQLFPFGTGAGGGGGYYGLWSNTHNYLAGSIVSHTDGLVYATEVDSLGQSPSAGTPWQSIGTLDYIDPPAALRTLSTATTMSVLDSVLLVSGTTTISLPDPALAIEGRLYVIKNIGVAVVTVHPATGDNLEGVSADFTLASHDSITLVSNLVDGWWIA